MDSKVYYIKNMRNFKVFYKLDSPMIRRSLAPRRIMRISEDERNAILYDAGIAAMFSDGILVFCNEKGVPILRDDEVNINYQFYAMDQNEVDDVLKNGDATILAEILKEADPSLKQMIVDRAVELKITDNVRASFIKKYTGLDVIDLVKRASE